jgi:hypothetical protein
MTLVDALDTLILMGRKAGVRHADQAYGRSVYFAKAKRALAETYRRRSAIGLVGESIDVRTGEWATNTFGNAGGYSAIRNVSRCGTTAAL